MAVPKFFDFFYPVLVVLENQGATKVPILRQKVADLMKLTVEEREQLVPSGTQSTYGNRVAWALSYMKKAQLVKSPLRGTYEITPAGRRALIEVGDRIDLNYLEKSTEFREFRYGSPDNVKSYDLPEAREEDVENTPEEIIEGAYQNHRLSRWYARGLQGNSPAASEDALNCLATASLRVLNNLCKPL